MTKIPLTFYLFQPDARAHGLAAMLQKHLARDKRAMVMVDDAAAAKKIDDFLWDYSHDDFLPHDVAQDNDHDQQQPILIMPLDSPRAAGTPLAGHNAAAAVFFMLDHFADIATSLKTMTQMTGQENIAQWIFLFCQHDQHHEAIMAKIFALVASDENNLALTQWQQTPKGTWQGQQ